MELITFNDPFGIYSGKSVDCFDDVCGSLSDEDILLAQSAFCNGAAPIAGADDFSMLCQMDKASLDTEKMWNAAESLKHAAGIFSPESSIYNIVEIEALVSSKFMKRAGLQLVSDIYASTAKFSISHPNATGRELVDFIYQSMGCKGIEFKPQAENEIGVSHFFSSLCRRELNERHEEKFFIDCDISAIVAYVVAKELGFPVELGLMRNHVVLWWKSPTETFIADQGEFHDAAYYQKKIGAATTAEVEHRSNVESIVLSNMGVELFEQRECSAALEYFKTALEFDPENISALLGACQANLFLVGFDAGSSQNSEDGRLCVKSDANNPGSLDEARAYCMRAYQSFPSAKGSNLLLGIVLFKLGDFSASLELIEKTLNIDPNDELAKKVKSIILSRMVNRPGQLADSSQVDNSKVSR